MRILCILFLSIGVLHSAVYAQDITVTATKSVRVQELKPTVYLNVVRTDKKKAWLRLTNNTNWAISVSTTTTYFYRKIEVNLAVGKTVFGLPTDEDIDSLHYYVEKEPMTSGHLRTPELHYPDSSAASWIPSKGSILFSVPIEQLKPGLLIYVPYHYEWELSHQFIFTDEPEHRVYYRGFNLSKDTRATGG